MNDNNKALLPETLLSTFKRLTPQQVVKVREVCKQWLELVNENRALWRILEISKVRSPEEAQAVLDQYDERSGSTLEAVSVRMELGVRKLDGPQLEPNFSEIESLGATMEKSLATLLVISRASLWSTQTVCRFGTSGGSQSRGAQGVRHP